ncbi:MAG: glycoside hydrolase family 3 [Chloroflexi bacterium]|nr:MAG: glycoside hydrolase family 3 [Chloroflexota bacterium]
MPELTDTMAINPPRPGRASRRHFLKLLGGGAAAAALFASGRKGFMPVAAQSVSLESMIGQMLMVGFRGLEVHGDSPIIQDIRDRHLGGVVLFDYDVPTQSPVRNIQSPDQVKALIQSLQAAAAVPLLISIDEEGGKVRRLKPEFGFPPAVSAECLGKRNDLDRTRQQASTIARTLAELGINLNLAPVVDLNTNPDNPVIGKLDRSFSADPAIVASHALAFIQAHHEQGVLCTLKHFPGHGSSTSDSHGGFVDVTDSWSSVEVEPYRRIMEAGQADAIMTAHVFNAKLDPQYPATLSKPTITGLLRGEMKYDGVVICDDLQMGAIADHYGFDVAIHGAIEAGADIIMIANNSTYEEQAAARAVALIRQVVEDGTISKDRIAQSYQRIQRLKQKLRAGSLQADYRG